MATKIAIIGLGQIGSSIGLGFRQRAAPTQIVGCDKDRAVAREATEMGAVELVTSLKHAVQDADIVFLCLPLSQMEDTIRQLGPHLKDTAVVLETSPVKSPVTGWIQAYLRAGQPFLGLIPAVTPAVLGSPAYGVKSARVDLFQRTVMAIVARPNTAREVEQLGANIARLLGAKPLIVDPVEADGLMTSAHILPQLAASALLETCLAESGWAEARKLAGRPFAGVTGGMAYYDDPRSLEVAALANPAGVVHALEVMIAALSGMREDIARGNADDVRERLTHSFRAREQWLDEREHAAWLNEGDEPIDVPDFGERAAQMLFGGAMVDRSKYKKGKHE